MVNPYIDLQDISISESEANKVVPRGIEFADYNFKNHLLPEEESWESLDFKTVSETLAFSGVNLGNGKGRVLGGENGGGAFVLRGEFLAVTTR